jgi:hypothetical protein
MQTTYKYYKFPSKEAVPKPEEWPSNVSYSEIGLMYNNDAKLSPTGSVLIPATAKPGWFVNVCYNTNPLINLDFIKQYEINVETPSFLWLGQNNQ